MLYLGADGFQPMHMDEVEQHGEASHHDRDQQPTTPTLHGDVTSKLLLRLPWKGGLVQPFFIEPDRLTIITPAVISPMPINCAGLGIWL